MSSLLAISGHEVGRRFTLGELTRVGRAPDNEIVLPDNLVSRYHAQFEKKGLTYSVADLGSKNGILVNDQKEVEHRLRRGDRVTIGKTTLVFDAPQELKTARFTNTLIHLDPDQDDTMRVVETPTTPDAGPTDATALIVKLAQLFETASAADLPEVLQKILRDVLDMLGATAGSILLRSRDDEVVPLTAQSNGDELHLNKEATRLVLVEGKAVLTASLFAPPEGKTVRRARKAMIVPMIDREHIFGAIHLERPEGSDYTLKDISFMQALSRLVAGAIRQAIKIDQLGQAAQGSSNPLLGESEAMNAIRIQIGRVASTDSTVLITGETGTGKELVARAIHQQSNRAAGPLIAINCAAIPDSLIESELFGYERGAFTGADAMKRGKVEIADSGTLFLDEIGEMHIDLQPKLLRFLEERIYYRVGGVRPIQTDVRIIAATNRNLEDEVKEGRFRNDLLYRLNVVGIQMPPLRKRHEDIRTIVNQFAPKLAARLGKPFLGIHDLAWISLETYSWPGNVRELLQSLERALILSDDGILRREHFQIPESSMEHETTGTHHGLDDSTNKDANSPPPPLSEVEKKAIIRALRFSGGNRIRAAEILGIHRNTLRYKIEEYGIEV